MLFRSLLGHSTTNQVSHAAFLFLLLKIPPISVNTKVHQHHRIGEQSCLLTLPMKIPKVTSRAGDRAPAGAKFCSFPCPSSLPFSINLWPPPRGCVSLNPHFKDLRVSRGVCLSLCPRERPILASCSCEPLLPGFPPVWQHLPAAVGLLAATSRCQIRNLSRPPQGCGLMLSDPHVPYLLPG